MDTLHTTTSESDSITTLADDLLNAFHGDRLLAAAALADELLLFVKAQGTDEREATVERHCIERAADIFGMTADEVRVGILRLLAMRAAEPAVVATGGSR